MEGWIKIYRITLDKPIWVFSTPEQKVILITLLLMANHKENSWEWKGEKYICKPGQFITSLEGIVKKAGKGITIQNVRTSLKRFENLDFLTDESTKQNRLITICNWDIYQDKNEEPNNEANRQLTTNKNDKNVKNDKNIRINKAITNNNSVDFLQNRKILFKESLMPFVEKYSKETVRAFYDYWSEVSQKNNKMKWEMQKTWETNLRLSTWKRNENSFSKKINAVPVKQSVLEHNKEVTRKYMEGLINERSGGN